MYKIDVEEGKHFLKDKTGCWEWIRYRNKKGYGSIRRNNKTWLAHRYLYYIFNNDFNKSLYVLHKCDNPACVNPNHLYQGNQSDNMKDMYTRDRRSVKGENNSNCKYSDILVEEIRSLYKTKLFTLRSLGQLFGISKSMVGYYVNNSYR